MTKAELISKIAEDAGLTKANAGVALESFLEGVTKDIEVWRQAYACRLRYVLSF